MTSVRILSFNLHRGRTSDGTPSLAQAAALIAHARPEMAALQEVHSRLPGPRMWDDQPRRLRALLGGTLIFLPSIGLGQIGYGNAVWLARPPQAVTHVRLPGRGEPRSAILIRTEIAGRAVRLLATHLGLCPLDRARQSSALARIIAGCREPTIAAGDWNSPPAGEEIARLLDAGLRATAPAGVPTFPSRAPVSAPDYVLASTHFRTLGVRAIPSLVSDHLPVVADLEFLPAIA